LNNNKKKKKKWVLNQFDEITKQTNKQTKNDTCRNKRFKEGKEGKVGGEMR